MTAIDPKEFPLAFHGC